MDVRFDRRGIVQRTSAYKARLLAPAICAPECSAARLAAVYDMRSSAVRRLRIGTRFARKQFDAIGFDNGVEHEGAAGLALAIEAMTAMHEHGHRCHPVFDGAAGAAAGKVGSHRMNSPRVLFSP